MSERLGLSADEVLTTTRSVRKRLDLTRPVPRDVLIECIDIAHQSPTGSNSMRWRWMIIEDAAKRKAIADIYRTNFEAAYAGARATPVIPAVVAILTMLPPPPEIIPLPTCLQDRKVPVRLILMMLSHSDLGRSSVAV